MGNSLLQRTAVAKGEEDTFWATAVLLLFLILGRTFDSLSLACGVAISISLPHVLESRRSSELLQTELCSSLLGEEKGLATELGFHDFAVYLEFVFSSFANAVRKWLK